MYCCPTSALFLKGQIGLLSSRVIDMARYGVFILFWEARASYHDRSAGRQVDRSMPVYDKPCTYMHTGRYVDKSTCNHIH